MRGAFTTGLSVLGEERAHAHSRQLRGLLWTKRARYFRDLCDGACHRVQASQFASKARNALAVNFVFAERRTVGRVPPVVHACDVANQEPGAGCRSDGRFQSRYNVITGEAGAGKSILIGALNLVLGERADRTLIRSGCESCSVEAVFDVAQLRSRCRAFSRRTALNLRGKPIGFETSFTAAEPIDSSSMVLPRRCRHSQSVGQWLVDIHDRTSINP